MTVMFHYSFDDVPLFRDGHDKGAFVSGQVHVEAYESGYYDITSTEIYVEDQFGDERLVSLRDDDKAIRDLIHAAIDYELRFRVREELASEAA